MVGHEQIARSNLKVLFIDGDLIEGAAIARILSQAQISAIWAVTGMAGLELKSTVRPNIALVDLALPDIDSFELVRRLSDHGDCGIIAISSLTVEEKIVRSLEGGADDYLVKPPRPGELVARIWALYRRVKTREIATIDHLESTTQLGRIKFDHLARLIRVENGDYVPLTTAEYTALAMLLAAKGKPVSRDRLSLAALNRQWSSEDRGVDQLIFVLRQKLAVGNKERLIHSIRGVGYMISVSSLKSDMDKMLDPVR
jgi:DNA-binding response OmpR family regulator